MVEQTVELKNGLTKRIVADNDADLKEAVAAAKNEQEGVAFDINVPVRKGHDLLTYGEDFAVHTVDGTGAHNSPRDAVRDDGSIEGSDPLLVVPSAEVPHAAQANLKELVSDGNLADAKEEDLAAGSKTVNEAEAEVADKPSKADTQNA